MSGPKVAIRVDASTEIGSGHVVRCLTLARTLRGFGASVRFISRAHEGNLAELVRAAGFEITLLERTLSSDARSERESSSAHSHWLGADWRDDAAQTARAIGTEPVDWLIVDHYALDARWQKALRPRARRIAVVDDLADRPHDCDLLLDQNIVRDMEARYDGLVSSQCRRLIGPQFALLQPEYVASRQEAIGAGSAASRGTRAVVSFGGYDAAGLTSRAVDALLRPGLPELEADVILSSETDQYAVLSERLADRPNIRLHDRQPSLAPFLAKADFAIGAGGSTSWERLCLGLPSIVVTMAGNQRPIAEELAARGFVDWVGDTEEASVERLTDAVARVVARLPDPAFGEEARMLVDGCGASRVAALLMAGRGMSVASRRAEAHDEKRLLEWANDPVTRQNAFNPRAIAPEEHHRWFTSRLARPERATIFVMETYGVPLGQVRFERQDGGEWEISYALDPLFRGRGAAEPMLGRAIANFREGADAPLSLLGHVKPGNAASCRVFEKLGFEIASSDAQKITFRQAATEQGN